MNEFKATTLFAFQQKNREKNTDGTHTWLICTPIVTSVSPSLVTSTEPSSPTCIKAAAFSPAEPGRGRTSGGASGQHGSTTVCCRAASDATAFPCRMRRIGLAKQGTLGERPLHFLSVFHAVIILLFAVSPILANCLTVWNISRSRTPRQ